MTTEFLAEAAGLLDNDFITHNPTIKINGNSLVNLLVTAKYVEKKLRNGDYFKGYIDRITGELIQGTRLNFRSGGVYEGWFKNGLRHDGYEAVYTYGNGSKFVGSFVDDRSFEGTLLTHDYTYNGSFHPYYTTTSKSSLPSNEKNDQYQKYRLPIFDGYGTLALRNGTIYEGEFKYGQYHGIGKLKSCEGTRYIGHFAFGLRHGIVAVFFPSTQLCFTQMWYKDRIVFSIRKTIFMADNDNDVVEESTKVKNCSNNIAKVKKNIKKIASYSNNNIETLSQEGKVMINAKEFFFICWNHLLLLEERKNESCV